jgi:translation initiation factor IF-1
MSGKNAFKVEGIVIEVMTNRTCWVELSNGHRVRGFAVGPAKMKFAALAAGDRVWLQLSAYDMSTGRVILES